MAQIHNMIGRRIAASNGPVPLDDLIRYKDREDIKRALTDMALKLHGGMVYSTRVFEANWCSETNQWDPQPAQLYRFYDAKGVLLYVGITGRMHNRVKQHRDNASWFEVAARVDIEHYPTRADALRAETVAIKAEHPLHNIVHNTPLVMPPKKPQRRKP